MRAMNNTSILTLVTNSLQNLELVKVQRKVSAAEEKVCSLEDTLLNQVPNIYFFYFVVKYTFCFFASFSEGYVGQLASELM